MFPDRAREQRKTKQHFKITTDSYIIKAPMLGFQENVWCTPLQFIFIPVISNECCSQIKQHAVFLSCDFFPHGSVRTYFRIILLWDEQAEADRQLLSVCATIVPQWQWWNSLIISSLQASDPHPICLLWSLLNWASQLVPSHTDTEIIGLYKYRSAKRNKMVLLGFQVCSSLTFRPTYAASTRHPSLPLGTW